MEFYSVKGGVSDTSGDKSKEMDGVRAGVKGCTHIKEKRMESQLESAAKRRSLVIFIRAVCVL